MGKNRKTGYEGAKPEGKGGDGKNKEQAVFK